MSHMLTVYKKELRSYVVSPIPYVFMIIFTAFMSWFFFWWGDGQFWVIGKATLEVGFFDILPWVLIFLVPAISMRLWSEEFRGGTLEQLMTMPVSTAAVAVGKFLAAWTLLLICLVLTLPIPITVASLGDLDWGPVLGGYLGGFLLGGALLALGVWISSLTQHQIVAFLMTLVAGFFLIIIQALGSPGSGWGAFVEQLSLRTHYDSMGRGVIDLRDVVYFLTFIGLFVYMNTQSIDNRRVRSMINRNYRIWSHSVLSCILLLVCVLLLNAAFADVNVRADLTEEGLYTLSDGTHSILERLRDPVTMDIYWGGTPTETKPSRRYVRGLLEEMAAIAGDKITVRWIDTDEEDGKKEAEDAGISEYQFGSVEGDRQVVSTGYMTLRIESGDMAKTDIDTLAVRTQELEYLIAQDLDRRTRVGSAGVALANPDSPLLSQPLGGPRSAPGRFNLLRSQLQGLFQEDLRILASLDEPVPDEIQVLLLVAPWNLSELAAFHVDQFVVRGGRLLLLLDNVNVENTVVPQGEREPRSSGLEDWLNHLGVTAEYGLVGDFGTENRGEYWFVPQQRGRYPYWPIAPREQLDTSHTAMAPLPSIYSFVWPSALRADMALHDEAGRTVDVLATTSSMGHRRAEIGNVGGTLDFPMPIASELEEIPLILQITGPFASMWKGKERPLSESERLAKEQAEREAAEKAAEDEGDGDEPGGEPAAGDPDGGEPPAAAGDPDGGGDDAGKKDDDAPKDDPGGGDGGDGDDGEEGDDAPAEEEAEPRFDDGDIHVVIVGDAEIAADYMFQRDMLGRRFAPNGAGGMAFAVNMVDWLRGSEDLMSLRSRDTNPRLLEQIEDSDRKWIKLVNVLAMPILLLCIGLVVFAVRRSS